MKEKHTLDKEFNKLECCLNLIIYRVIKGGVKEAISNL